VQRYYGISDVLVATAGGGGHHEENGASNTHLGRIEGIDDAARIRDLVMSRVRASRTAGLGDERHEHAATGSPVGPAWTPQHVAVLREIRQAVADLRSASM
jgi:hypothetical protein